MKNILYEVVKLDKSEIIHRKYHAKSLSKLADWELLARNYIIAHNRAIEKSG